MMFPDKLHKFLDRYLGIPIVLFSGVCSERAKTVFSPSRVLLIQISAIGDVILLTPALRDIRRRYPSAHFTMVTSSINQQLLKHCPYLDETLMFNLKECAKSPVKFFRFIQSLRERRFDLAIDFEHWPRLSALLAYASGAKRRIGFRADGQHRHYVFTDVVEHVRGKHELLSYMEIAKLMGCKTEDASHCRSIFQHQLSQSTSEFRPENIENCGGLELEVWVGEEDNRWAGRFLKSHGVKKGEKVVCIHPDAGRTEPRRRWTIEGYVEVADALTQRHGIQILLTGAPSEVTLSQQIAQRIQSKAIIATGKTDVNQLAALFSRCAFVLCGNCGPMHLAAAVGTPVVALHGPTNPAQWGPWGKEHIVIKSDIVCSPCLNLGFEYGCKSLPDGTSMCMKNIPVETVLMACERQLQAAPI